MTNQELINRILLILSRSKLDEIYGPLRSAPSIRYERVKRATVVYVEESCNAKVVNDQVILLKLLYSGLSPEDQAIFLNVLKTHLLSIHGIIVVHVLVELGKTKLIKASGSLQEESKHIFCHDLQA